MRLEATEAVPICFGLRFVLAAKLNEESISYEPINRQKRAYFFGGRTLLWRGDGVGRRRRGGVGVSDRRQGEHKRLKNEMRCRPGPGKYNNGTGWHGNFEFLRYKIR